MPVDPRQVQVDADFITSQPGWSDPEKRRDFIREVAVKSRSQVEPELHGAVISELWNRADDRGLLKKGADFTGRALEEVVKSMPATGGAVMFAANDLIQGTPLGTGGEAPDTGSIERFKRGLVNLWDTSGQRVKQIMPGESNQASRDKSLNALKTDIDNNLHPQGLESWLAGDFDDGSQKPDTETQEWLDLLSSGIAKKAVAADYMGKVDPERVRAWMESDRNPLRADSDIPGQPGPREFLADYVATRDPSSWASFVERVTETDAQHTTRLRRWVAEQKSRPVIESMPEGLGKEMVARSMDMQTSPIDLATAVLPLLRGAKALKAAKAGMGVSVIKDVAMGGLKEGAQEGLTTYLDDPRATTGQVLESAAMGAVGSTVLEGGMGATGAVMEKLTRPEQQATPGVQQNPESLQQPASVPNSMASIAARAGSQPVQWQTTRQPILTDVPDGPPTLTVPSPGKESLRPVQTVPESPATLQEQLTRTAEGLKPATFIPAQSSSNVSVPEGLVSTPVTSPEPGVMVHRPELDPAAVQQASQEAPGQLMGMGIPTKPADADRAIVLRRADGTSVLDVASNAETEPQVREALQKMAKEGDAITVESPESVIQERQGLPRTAPRVGEIVNHEGYTGRLIQDGSRFAVQVPNGPLVEVSTLSSLARNTDPRAAQAQGLAELEQQGQNIEVKEAGFEANPDGSLTIQDGAGNTYVPHNPQLLRSVRTGPNGLEVLVRDPRKPGQVIKLTGNQAQNAQEALLNAAQNVEAKGGKVNWGRSRFQFSTLGTIWSKLKSTTAAPLRFLQTDRAGLIDYARKTLEAGPQTIQAPDGRTIALVHNKQGTKETLFEHLTTESNGKPSPERAAWVPRIATTLKNAAARIQDGKNMIYIARYSERGGRRDVHFVVVSPEGYVTDQGPLDALTTHWARNETRPGQKPRSTEQLLSHFEDLEALQFSLTKKNAVKPTVSDSDPTTGTRANISAQSTRTPGYTVWVNPESGLTESQVKELLSPPPTLGEIVKGNAKQLTKMAGEAVRLLNSHLPGLVSPKVRIFATPQDYLNSGYVSLDRLDADDLAKIQDAEGFHDRVTGDTVIIASNVNLRKGETPRGAIARVIMHERIGHEGINVLLDSDPEFKSYWEALSSHIPQADLDAIASEMGYADIALDRAQLALEWLARQAELGAQNLEQGLAARMWEALKAWIKKAWAGFSGKTDFDQSITDILALARQAVLQGTSTPTTPESLAHRLRLKSTPGLRYAPGFERQNNQLRRADVVINGMRRDWYQLDTILDPTAPIEKRKAALSKLFNKPGLNLEFPPLATLEDLLGVNRVELAELQKQAASKSDPRQYSTPQSPDIQQLGDALLESMKGWVTPVTQAEIEANMKKALKKSDKARRQAITEKLFALPGAEEAYQQRLQKQRELNAVYEGHQETDEDPEAGFKEMTREEYANSIYAEAERYNTFKGMGQGLQFSLGGTRVFHRDGEPYRVNDRATRAILTGTTLPRVFVETVAATERERRALDQTAAQLGADLDAAIQSYAERSGRPLPDIYELVNQALSGAPGTNAVLMQADPALHTRALRARTFLDDLSQAIANTLPVGELRNTIVLNQGAWMKRSYAAFDPASGWNYDTVMQAAREGRDLGGRPARQIVNNAIRYLRQRNPQASRAEIEADMRDLMDRDSWTGYLTGKAAIRKDVSSLMARQSLPPEIRFLMGEESNPIKRLAQSASFQSQFLHRHQQQTALRAIGLSNGLFQSQRGGVYTQEIPHDNPRWSPLAGIWTTPQLWQAMQEMDGLNSGNTLWAKAGEALKFLGNEAKFNRVAANPDSWLVNAMGNVVALVQTGDVFYSSFFRRVGEAVSLHRSGRAKPGEAQWNVTQTSTGQTLTRVSGVPGTVLNAAEEAVIDAQRALLARLTASGVMGESFTLRDLEASISRHLLQWVEQDGLRDRVLGAVKAGWWGQSAGRGLGPVGRVIGGIVGAATGGTVGYQGLQNVQQTLAAYVMTGPDAIGRLTGFLGNYETALSAGMTPDQAFAHASDRTRNTFPDYGRMPEILKTLSRYGVAGSFIGFQYEVYRNAIWNLRYAHQDLRSGNAALVRKGIARAIGAASVGTLAAGGLQAIFQGLAGTDDERNKKWRKWFAAPWEKNGVLVFTDYTPEGVSYFNTSYLVPQATMMELVNAAKSGEDPIDAAGRVAGHVWEQFMGSSVHLGPIIQAFTYKDRAGNDVTNKKGLAGAWESFDEAQKTIFEPGWAAKFERLEYALREAERRGRKFSVEEELKRLFGIREFTRTHPDAVKRGYEDNFVEKYAKIRREANKVLGNNLPGAQVKAITEANAAIQALTTELQSYEADLRYLGVPDIVIRKARKESSMPTRFSLMEIDPEKPNRVRSRKH